MRGQTVPDGAAGLLSLAQQAQHEKLQMGQSWEVPLHRHKVTLCTMA